MTATKRLPVKSASHHARVLAFLLLRQAMRLTKIVGPKKRLNTPPMRLRDQTSMQT